MVVSRHVAAKPSVVSFSATTTVKEAAQSEIGELGTGCALGLRANTSRSGTAR
jgi:hypothetical protein